MSSSKERRLLVQKWVTPSNGRLSDGISLHMTESDLREYVAAEGKGRVTRYPDATPYWWDNPDLKIFAEVQASKHGIHSYLRPLPGSGGVDGWRY